MGGDVLILRAVHVGEEPDLVGPERAGDAVDVANGAVVIGKGICNYSAADLHRVKGMKTEQVREVVPGAAEEAVHRDYFVLA